MGEYRRRSGAPALSCGRSERVNDIDAVTCRVPKHYPHATHYGWTTDGRFWWFDDSGMLPTAYGGANLLDS